MSTIKLAASLPQAVYSAKQLLDYEQQIAASQGIELFQLMSMAGQAVFDHIVKHHVDTKYLLILAGKGNNGGDGFIIAALALKAGYAVDLVLSCSPEQLKGDALQAYQEFKQLPIDNGNTYSITDFLAHDYSYHQNLVIIDSLFGIGFNGALPEGILPLVEQINQQTVPVISVDLPSGLNATTGAIENLAIKATETISFIAFKQGLLTGQAANAIGKLYLADLTIGEAFQQQVTSQYFIQGKANLPVMPVRYACVHKGDIGMVLAVGGGEGMPGAIRLASEASLRMGAGLVAVACHQNNQVMVFNGRPELMLAPTSAQKLTNSHQLTKAKVLLLGPGLGQDTWAQELFSLILQQPKRIVLDADGLNLLAQLPKVEQQAFKRDNWVLTPHPLEAARLLNISVKQVAADRFSAVKTIAQRFGGICLLKGAGTLISDGQQVWINTSGNPGMASGGMGDVLAGMIAACLLQFNSPLEAVRYACFIHGYTADKLVKKSGQLGLLAGDVVCRLFGAYYL